MLVEFATSGFVMPGFVLAVFSIIVNEEDCYEK